MHATQGGPDRTLTPRRGAAETHSGRYHRCRLNRRPLGMAPFPSPSSCAGSLSFSDNFRQLPHVVALCRRTPVLRYGPHSPRGEPSLLRGGCNPAPSRMGGDLAQNAMRLCFSLQNHPHAPLYRVDRHCKAAKSCKKRAGDLLNSRFDMTLRLQRRTR
jgi:hypothetical protein